jgi:RNA polymerase sigma-70 factor (ECF subfamily)
MRCWHCHWTVGLIQVEPETLLAGVTGVSADDAGSGEAMRQLYVASYARLVGVVGAVVGDRHEAEEAVQDAFVRLLGRWATVSRYDDPEAWLRKVALGYASNRRRKRVNGLKAARRHGPSADVPGPDPGVVDLQRALAALPERQREAIVLQQALGLDVAGIARLLGVAEGTVKSRLSRARAALAPLLREDVSHHV